MTARAHYDAVIAREARGERITAHTWEWLARDLEYAAAVTVMDCLSDPEPTRRALRATADMLSDRAADCRSRAIRAARLAVMP